MKPSLQPSSTFLLSTLLLISVNVIPPCSSADDYQFTNCSKHFSCGGIIPNLKYPFWGGHRPAYCGLPDFELECEGNFPEIIIQSITYRILDFDWTQKNLRVARDDYFGTLCPSHYKNNSFDPTKFEYVEGLVDVTFLYDCTNSSSFQPDQSMKEICMQDDGTYKDVYYVFQNRSVNESDCKSSVVMPVFQSQTQAVMENRIQKALDQGFGLKWLVDDEQCNTCVASGGECGYDKTKGHSCFCKDKPHVASCSAGAHLSWRHKTAIGISAGVTGISLISILIICKRKILKETGTFNHHSLKNFMKNYGPLAPKQYSYSEVKRMTKSFSDKLGQGGYGVVYKASLPDGRLVAVKVIRESKGSEEEFINEVVSISRTSHVNVVTLLGFCYERNKKALIYDYMPNGSLDKFIHNKGSPTAFHALELKALFQIAVGIARGLEYLHRGCNTRILHFDIKPQNILLDEDFCPKIADFGLAKICQKKDSIVSILGARGTAGFIAPEVFSRAFGGVSHKSDVYSYGMLVLDMVGGRKDYDSGGSFVDEMYFSDWIHKDVGQTNSHVIFLSTTGEEYEVIRKMTLVSLWCIQTNPSDRPTMSKVVEMLEGPLHLLLFPPKPSLQCPSRSPLHLSNGIVDDLEASSRSTWKEALIE